MSDPLDLISVYQGANVTEAHLVKNLLLAEEINAFVSEENELLPGLEIEPPHVLVARKDEDRARAVIDEYENEQSARAARPDWTCPACGANNIGAVDACDACGKARPGSEAEAEDEEEDWNE